MASYQYRAKQQSTQFEHDLRVKEQQLAQRERALQERERMLFSHTKLPRLPANYYKGIQQLADMMALKWGDTLPVQEHRRNMMQT